MPIIAAKRKLAIALETGGFAVDPSADGSGYLNCKTQDLGFPEDTTELLETNYNTGRNTMTKKDVGPDGASLSFGVPLQGLLAAAGNGATPAAADWLDILLTHMFGAPVILDGDAVASSNAGDVTMEDDIFQAPFDLIPVQEPGVHNDLTQWRRSEGAASPYAVHRNWDDNPTAAAIAYGRKLWLYQDPIVRDTLAAHAFVDDRDYTLLGGGITSASIAMPAGQRAVMSLQAAFDRKIQETKANLPDMTAGSIDNGTPIQGELAEIEFNGVCYAASNAEVDFGLDVAPITSVKGDNGRGDMKAFAAHPVIRFQPQFASALEDAFRAGTCGSALLRFGSGVLGSGRLNTLCVYFEQAQVDEPVNPTEDGQLIRQAITLRAVDPGLDGSGNRRPYWGIARA